MLSNLFASMRGPVQVQPGHPHWIICKGASPSLFPPAYPGAFFSISRRFVVPAYSIVRDLRALEGEVLPLWLPATRPSLKIDEIGGRLTCDLACDVGEMGETGKRADRREGEV